MAKETRKVPVLQKLLEDRVDPSTGLQRSGRSLVVTSDDILDAMRACKSTLSTKNPANFLKDLLRSNARNTLWSRVTPHRWTARQVYGDANVFEFAEFEPGQTEAFPDPFDLGSLGDPHQIQAVSLDAYARTLGRPDESWLIQTCVSQRVIETHFALRSTLVVQDVHHLQNSVKITPEIDAIFLMNYRVKAGGKPQRAIITLEAKRRELILVDQIKAQIAKMGAVYKKAGHMEINTIVALACRSFEVSKESRIGIFEMEPVALEAAAKFDEDKEAWKVPLKITSAAAYVFKPSVAGI